MSRLLRTLLYSSLLATLAVGLAACGDDDEGSRTGTLQLTLVDAPADLAGLEAITIVIDRVRIHASADAEGNGGGWFDLLPDTLDTAERTHDLLELVNGVEAVLGEIEIPVGRYTQIRFGIESATITIDGVTEDLTIPSGMQSGLKLISPFEIRSDEITALTLDFDAGRSIHEAPSGSGNYILRPTIRVVPRTVSGAITGKVTPLGIGAMLMAVDAADGDTTTTTFADPIDGGYELPALPAGTYHVLASAPGYADASDSNVAVAAGVITPDVDFVLEALESIDQ